MLNVSILLADIGIDKNVILAGLFCNSSSKGNTAGLAEKLPADVWNIVRKIEEKNTEEVILINLAERLHNMCTIDYIDADKKAQKAKETIQIYMPLARRINNQKLTDELNDLAMKYSV